MHIYRYIAPSLVVAVILSATLAVLPPRPTSAPSHRSPAITASATTARPQPAADSIGQWFRRMQQRVLTFVRALLWRPRLVIRDAARDPAQQAVIDYLRAHDRVDPRAEPQTRLSVCPPLWSRTFERWLSPACAARR